MKASERKHEHGAAAGTYGGSLGVSDVEDLVLTRHLQDVVNDGRQVLQSHFIMTAETQHVHLHRWSSSSAPLAPPHPHLTEEQVSSKRLKVFYGFSFSAV